MKNIYSYLIVIISFLPFALKAQESIITLNTDHSGATYDKEARYAVFLKPGFSYRATSSTSFWAHINSNSPQPDIGNITYVDPESFPTDIDSSLPVGSIPGQAGVSQTGAANYTIPIEVPPAAQGLKPSLSLVYNSHAGNGTMGIGWAVAGVSSISRVPKDIYHDGIVEEVKLNTTDNFALDGMRLVLIDETQGQKVYHTKNESYVKVTAQGASGVGPEWFKVETKDGLTMEYGRTANSYLNVSGDNTIFAWHINKVYDQYGNYMEFVWNSIPAAPIVGITTIPEIYLSSIKYGGNTTQNNNCYNTIHFQYVKREDVKPIHVEGVGTIMQQLLLKNIDIESNNTFVSKYSLAYMYDGISKLVSVDLTGGQGDALNKTIYNWGVETSSGAISSSQFMADLPDDWFDDIIMNDIDGDNRTDLVYMNSEISEWKLFIFQGQYDPLTYEEKDSGTLENVLQVFAGDINSNGKNSVFMLENASGSDKLKEYNYNPTTEQLELINTTDLPSTDCQVVQFGDFDGDGIQDIIAFDADNNVLGIILGETAANINLSHVSNPERVELVDANGNGKTDVMIEDNNGSYVIYELVSGNTSFYQTRKHLFPGSETNWFIGEFDGDSRTDILFFESGEWKISHAGAMNGYLEETGLPIRSMNLSSDFFLTVNDINNDGYDDIFEVYYQIIDPGWVPRKYYEYRSIHYNNGNGTFTTVNMDRNVYALPSPSGVERRFIFTDLNGDLMKDYNFFEKYRDETNTTVMRGYPFRILPYFHSNLVTSVRNGTGLKSEFNYSRPIVENDTDPSVFVESLYRPPIYLVDNFKEQAGSLVGKNQTYKYSTPFIHKQGKGFLGFSEVEFTDAVTGFTQKNNYQMETYLANFCIHLVQSTQSSNPAGVEVFYQPLLIQSLILDGNADTITQTTSEYAVEITEPCLYLDYELFYVNTDKVTQKDYLQNLTTTTSYGYDDYGNPTYINTNYNGDATMQTNNIYTGFGSWWCPKSRLQQSTVTKIRPGETNYTTTTAYTWKNNGAPGTKTVFSGKAKAVTETYTNFDNFGNPQTITLSSAGEESRETLLEYNDGYGRFVTKRTNPLLHEEEFTYDGRTGNLLTHTDANGLITTHTYDGFGRPETIIYPDGNTTVLTRHWNIRGKQLFFTKEITGGQPEKRVYYDVLARKCKTAQAGFDGNLICSDIIYNTKGEQWKVSEPYPETSSASQHTLYDYCTNGRLNKITYPSGATDTWTYTEKSTKSTVTNSNGTYKTTETDGTGALTMAKDPAGEITYNYFAHGGIKDINHGGNTIEMTYDDYARQTSLKDPNAGTISYIYNAFGELTQQTDARGNTYNMEYDKLGRLDVKKLGTIIVADFTYDNAPGKAIGFLASLSGDKNITYTYEYDNLSRLIKKTENLDGRIFSVETGYNSKSQVSQIKYPGSTLYIVDNLYQNGYISSVTGTGQNSTTIYTANQYNTRGQLMRYTLGNSKVTTKSYSEYGLLTGISTPGIQNLTYEFNPQTGNLNWRKDAAKSIQEDFTYDNLMKNRLENWQVGTTTNTTTYYANGNVNTKTGLGAFAYNAPQPHAVSGVDNTDNIISSTTQDITYTAFNKVEEIIEQDEHKLVFTYGPDQQRKKTQLYVWQNSAWQLKTTKYFAGGIYEEEITEGLFPNTREINYINAGDGLAAIFEKDNQGQNLYYIHKDHLGSLQAISNSSGALVEEMSYGPWGRRRLAGNWNDYALTTAPKFKRGFTGHEHLDEFNLINMNGRIYDPILGRFLSPDNYVQLPDYSQSLNRYTYALNNPLIYTDPSGESWKSFWNSVGNWMYEHNVPFFVGYNSSFGVGVSVGNNPMHYPGYEKRITDGQQNIRTQIAGFRRMDQKSFPYYAQVTGNTLIRYDVNSLPEYAFIAPQNMGEWGQVGSDGLIHIGCMSCHSPIGAYHYAAYNSAERYQGIAAGATIMLAVDAGMAVAAAKSDTKSFSSMMEAGEAARYNAYWSRNAPRISTPSSRMTWSRISSRTGQFEKSVVTYDKVGRLNYRIDFSTHMRPAAHSNPHLHIFEYTPRFDPINGQETLFNFW